MNRLDKALDELRNALAGVAPSQMNAALALIENAKSNHIMAYGCGREALQLRGFVMRLHHLGLDVSMQGDVTAKPLGKGDLFLATAGPGELSTVRALMGEAIKAGADCLLITGLHNAPLAKLADTVLVLPTTTMANDRAAQPVLPMGSTFEGALFLMFELMVLDLRERLGETPHGMRARHTNME